MAKAKQRSYIRVSEVFWANEEDGEDMKDPIKVILGDSDLDSDWIKDVREGGREAEIKLSDDLLEALRKREQEEKKDEEGDQNA